MAYSFPLEDGSAFGNDPTLAQNHKLPILTKGPMYERTAYAGNWAYKTFAHMSANARKLLTSGAIVCVRFGLCGTVGVVKDGDWREEPTARNDFTEIPPRGTYSSKSLHTALEIIVDTKANWWAKNCHTGPGFMEEYARVQAYEDFTQAANIMGHWASTIKILNVAGVKGLRTFTSLGIPGEQEFSISPNYKCKFDSLPAGTFDIPIANGATYEPFVPHLATVCPFLLIPEIPFFTQETPARYHIAAKYLTGE